MLMQSQAKYQHFNFFVKLPLLKAAAIELVQELVGMAKETKISANAQVISASSISKALYVVRDGAIAMRPGGDGSVKEVLLHSGEVRAILIGATRATRARHDTLRPY